MWLKYLIVNNFVGRFFNVSDQWYIAKLQLLPDLKQGDGVVFSPTHTMKDATNPSHNPNLPPTTLVESDSSLVD